jgi:hypothetical protein
MARAGFESAGENIEIGRIECGDYEGSVEYGN